MLHQARFDAGLDVGRLKSMNTDVKAGVCAACYGAGATLRQMTAPQS